MEKSSERPFEAMVNGSVKTKTDMLPAREADPLAGTEGILTGQFDLGPDHVILSWDESLEAMTGRSAREMIGTRRQWEALYGFERPVLADFFIDDDFEGALRMYGPTGVWRSGGNGEWVAIGQFLDRSGRGRPVLARAWRRQETGEVVEALFSVEQVADWAKSSSDRYDAMRLLAESVPAGVAVMQDEKIIFVNQTFCSMFGYLSPSELIGRPSGDFLVEEQRHLHYQILRGLTRENSAQARYQWTGIDKNGRKIWFEGRPRPIEWNGGPAVLSFVLDITEYKQREELMERESRELRVENVRLKSSIDYRLRLGNIIGRSRKMQEVYDTILRASGGDSSIIIYGETGTGKELVAKAVHGLSHRGHGPFVPVNCGAVPEELFESEFFGYRKGAFTGAYADKIGFLDQARGGTLFLDEIAELSHYCQAKLLRVLGSGESMPVGAAEPLKTDFRLIAATNRPLEALVRQGSFREDLFYRLQVIPILLPSLRQRKEDIPYLVEHILFNLGAEGGVSSQDLALLLEHDWPGNVRELQNVLERYLALGHLDFLKPRARPGSAAGQMPGTADVAQGLRPALDRFERGLILQTLQGQDWNRTRTASVLRLPRKTLFRKMKKLGLEKADE